MSKTAHEVTSGPGCVIAVLGPTGVGKTAVAEALALRTGARIVSCDSMQLYRGFPVLTNQPRQQPGSPVIHELVGVLAPDARCSAVQYAAMARPLLIEDLTRVGWALLVGGTGLYMRATLAPLAVHEPGSPEVRRRLEERLCREGLEVLVAELERVDAGAAGAIDRRNPRRVVRALEVALTAGPSRWAGRNDLWQPEHDHPTVQVILMMDRQRLLPRLDARAAAMVAEGAVEEVRRYRGRMCSGGDVGKAGGPRGGSTAGVGEGGVTPGVGEGGGPGLRGGIAAAIGFREVERYLDGRVTEEELVESIARATRRYVRRQLTWLRRVRGAVIIDVRDRGAGDVADEILALANDTARSRAG